MSALVLDPDMMCPDCQSDSLNPRHGKGESVWWTECPDCGFADDVVWPVPQW